MKNHKKLLLLLLVDIEASKGQTEVCSTISYPLDHEDLIEPKKKTSKYSLVTFAPYKYRRLKWGYQKTIEGIYIYTLTK